jgi:hypothetical protein
MRGFCARSPGMHPDTLYSLAAAYSVTRGKLPRTDSRAAALEYTQVPHSLSTGRALFARMKWRIQPHPRTESGFILFRGTAARAARISRGGQC